VAAVAAAREPAVPAETRLREPPVERRVLACRLGSSAAWVVAPETTRTALPVAREAPVVVVVRA
jgi:hypothetical protein